MLVGADGASWSKIPTLGIPATPEAPGVRSRRPRKPAFSLGDLAARVAVPMTHETMLNAYASRFATNTMRRAYRMFGGDLTLFLVFGEIAHYNMSRALATLNLRDAPDSTRWKALLRELQAQKIAPCNALSISEATGIPRETVRRKVKELEKRGWLLREGARSLMLAPRAIEQMDAQGSAIMEDFRETARLIRMLEDAASRQKPR